MPVDLLADADDIFKYICIFHHKLDIKRITIINWLKNLQFLPFLSFTSTFQYNKMNLQGMYIQVNTIQANYINMAYISMV